MISGIDPSAARFLTDLARTQAKADSASRQLSSGLKFNDASDAPDQVSDILKLRADISRNAQIGSNLQNAKTEVDTAEQAVQGAELIMERVRVLAAQGVNGTQTPATRLAIAQEVGTLQQQLVSLSATQVGSSYVFGGDADQTAPYTSDMVTPDVGGGVVQANTAQATRQIQDPLGNTFGIDRTAQQIFDDQNPPGTIDFKIESMEKEPQLLQIVAPNEAVVAVGVEIRTGESTGMMNMAMPAIIIKMMRQKFEQQWSVRKAESTGTEQERMLRFLKDATVQLDSRLEGATFTVEDFLGLEDGDLLTFDHPLGRTLDCTVNGKQKFKGQVVRLGNKKAFRIA